MTRPAASAQAPRRRRTLEALKKAGAELLADQSIDGLAVNDIVARAGVAKGSFFNHFSDKEAFAEAIAADVRTRIEAEIAAANLAIDDPAVRVARALARLAAFCVDDPRAVRVMLRASPLGAAPDHPLNAGLRDDLAAGQALGRFRRCPVDGGVAFIVGVAAALAASLLKSADQSPRRCAMAMLEHALLGLGLKEADAVRIAGDAVALIPRTAAD